MSIVIMGGFWDLFLYICRFDLCYVYLLYIVTYQMTLCGWWGFSFVLGYRLLYILTYLEVLLNKCCSQPSCHLTHSCGHYSISEYIEPCCRHHSLGPYSWPRSVSYEISARPSSTKRHRCLTLTMPYRRPPSTLHGGFGTWFLFCRFIYCNCSKLSIYLSFPLWVTTFCQ